MFGDWIDRKSVDSCIILEPCHEPKVGHGFDMVLTRMAGARYWHFRGLFPESQPLVDMLGSPYILNPVGGLG